MIKHLISIGTPLAVLALTTYSLAKDGNAVAAEPRGTGIYEQSMTQKMQMLSDCRSTSVDVFFRDEYIKYHSAEVVNEALLNAQNCGGGDIDIVIFDINDNPLRSTYSVKTELSALLNVYNLTDYSNYEVEQTSLESRNSAQVNYLLNGLAAQIHFNLDKGTQNNQS